MYQVLDYIANMYDHAQGADSWWRRKTFADYAFGAIDFACQAYPEIADTLCDMWSLVWKPLFEELLDEADEGA